MTVGSSEVVVYRLQKHLRLLMGKHVDGLLKGKPASLDAMMYTLDMFYTVIYRDWKDEKHKDKDGMKIEMQSCCAFLSRGQDQKYQKISENGFELVEKHESEKSDGLPTQLWVPLMEEVQPPQYRQMTMKEAAVDIMDLLGFIVPARPEGEGDTQLNVITSSFRLKSHRPRSYNARQNEIINGKGLDSSIYIYIYKEAIYSIIKHAKRCKAFFSHDGSLAFQLVSRLSTT